MLGFSFDNSVLEEGMRTVVTCQTVEGDLPIHFKWFRNAEVVRWSAFVLYEKDDLFYQFEVKSIGFLFVGVLMIDNLRKSSHATVINYQPCVMQRGA